MRVNGVRSIFSFCAVCSAYCRSICWPVAVARLNDRNGIASYRKPGALPHIFPKKTELSQHIR